MRNLIPYRDYSPFDEMDRMINRMRQSMLQGMSMTDANWSESGRTLALNISEDEDNVEIEALVPGLTEDQIDVRIEGDTLTISGEYENRYERGDEDDRTWHVVEQSYGRFQRSLTLPAEVDTDNVEATLDNGVLTITLPKESPGPVKTIAVKAQKMLKGGDE